jgi:hypothetical protein
MELLERYLQAVKFWLPRKQKQDIIAELSEDIHSEIEEKETEIGRKLSEAEVETILKQRGRPMLVANRFLPQEHLIGPVLFPIYRLVLKIVLLCYLVPWVLVWIGLLIFNSGYRAEHTGPTWISALGSMWGSLWFAAFVAAATVTLIFAIIERTQAKSGLLEDWDPRKLPPVRNSNLIPRSSSVIELCAGMIFCLWWTANVHSPTVLNLPSLRISLSSQWRYFYWGYLILALFNISLAGVNLMRPYWTGLRATFRLLSDAAGIALLFWLLKSNILVEIAAVTIPVEKAAELTRAINHVWMPHMLPVVVILAVVIAVVDVFRIVRVKMSDVYPAGTGKSTAMA